MGGIGRALPASPGHCRGEKLAICPTAPDSHRGGAAGRDGGWAIVISDGPIGRTVWASFIRTEPDFPNGGFLPNEC